MKTLFKRSEHDGGYDFLGTSAYLLSKWDHRDEKISMLVTFCLHPKRSYSLIECENWENELRIFSDISYKSHKDEEWVELYIKKEIYQKLYNDLHAVVQNKPPYIMVFKISDTVFEVQALYNLSSDDLKIIKKYKSFNLIVNFILLLIFIYIIYLIRNIQN